VRQPWVIRQTLEKVYLDKSAITDQLVEEIYRPACEPGAAEVFASVFSTPQGEKVDVLLKQLTCPLLMLWGEADPWINARERGVKFRQYYPGLTEYFLRAGHCPHDEVPEQVKLPTSCLGIIHFQVKQSRVHHDRDVNAALNIWKFSESTVGSTETNTPFRSLLQDRGTKRLLLGRRKPHLLWMRCFT
jgi:hypothetical protein